MELLVKGSILIGVATLLLLTSCSRVEPESTQIRVLVDGEALRKDAAYYAKDQNVSLDEAVRRLELQDDVGELDSKLAASEPDTYGGLWLQHEPEFKVVVSMTDGAEKVSSYTRGTPLAQSVEVEIRKAAKSLRQLEAEQHSVVDTLEALKLPSESSINVYTNQVEVYVLNPEQLDITLKASGRSNTLEDVLVAEVDDFISLEVNIYAGNNMSCTSGYSVFDGNGTYGIATAGHCSENLSYGSVPLQMLAQWYGNSDLQWHRHTSGSHSYKPWARDNQPTSQGTAYYREIYSNVNRPEQAIGAHACKYGIAVGFTCGYINSKTVTPNAPYNQSTYIRFGNGNQNMSDPGDSGGPVYDGHAALGMHHGGVNSGTYSGNAVYMAINYVTDRGLRIYHAPR